MGLPQSDFAPDEINYRADLLSVAAAENLARKRAMHPNCPQFQAPVAKDVKHIGFYFSPEGEFTLSEIARAFNWSEAYALRVLAEAVAHFTVRCRFTRNGARYRLAYSPGCASAYVTPRRVVLKHLKETCGGRLRDVRSLLDDPPRGDLASLWRAIKTECETVLDGPARKVRCP